MSAVLLNASRMYSGSIYRVRTDGWHCLSLATQTGGEAISFSVARSQPLFVGAKTRHVQRRVLRIASVLHQAVPDGKRYCTATQVLKDANTRLRELLDARAAFRRQGWCLTMQQKRELCALLESRHAVARGLWDLQAALCADVGLDDTRPPVARRIKNMS